MRTGLLLIWVGAALVIGGVLYTAAQALWRGRLSRSGALRGDGPRDTLEPPERGRGLALGTNLPGLVMIGVGFLLLLAGAAF